MATSGGGQDFTQNSLALRVHQPRPTPERHLNIGFGPWFDSNAWRYGACKVSLVRRRASDAESSASNADAVSRTPQGDRPRIWCLWSSAEEERPNNSTELAQGFTLRTTTKAKVINSHLVNMFRGMTCPIMAALFLIRPIGCWL